MARNAQLIRQHKILQILERYRFGRLLDEIRDELVEELGLTSLHARTVRRDLEALQAAGLDLDVHESMRGRVWKMGPRARGSYKIAASATELIALSLSRDLLFPLAGTAFWQGIESFWNKLQDELPDSVWDHYDTYRRVLRVLGTPAKTYAKQQGTLKTINRAILEHRILEIQYQSINNPSLRHRRIEPYAVVFYKSSLYIVAAACEVVDPDNRVRNWKLDRFHKATALDQWFTPPDDELLSKHLGRSLGIFSGYKLQNYKIHLTPRAAAWVLEDPWHPDQKIQRRKDGSVVLTVQAVHDMEIIPRVLELGDDAQLLSPAACRRQIQDTIQRMAQRYKSGNDATDR